MSLAQPNLASWRVGCVAYLNAKPLIHGLEERSDVRLCLDVPSRLITELVNGQVDIALCPVIDYFRSTSPLTVVPVGAIACKGRTLTVRLFSRVPLNRINAIHADIDSHTSVALVQVVLHRMFGLRPSIEPFDAAKTSHTPESVLLIGDKVVAAAPSASEYPHELDLGEAWLQLTGLPFVFAVWMAKSEVDLGELPEILVNTRLTNTDRIRSIAMIHAPQHHWPVELAYEYLTERIRFEVGPPQLEAISRFTDEAHALGLINPPRPLQMWQAPVVCVEQPH